MIASHFEYYQICLCKFTRAVLQFGLSEKDLASHFAGPAFLPWQRMGNMEAFGGPLSPSWHNFTVGKIYLLLVKSQSSKKCKTDDSALKSYLDYLIYLNL